MDPYNPEARYVVPQMTEKTPYGVRHLDPYSKLFDSRIIFLSAPVDATSASDVVAQLLALNAADSETSITIYINSPGGNLTDMSMIVDTMNHVTAPVSTVALGLAASAAGIILAAGEKGLRLALPSARILLHQPRVEGSGRGQASDIEIQAKEIEYLRERMETFLSATTGQSLEVVRKDLERDKFMSAEDALAYGIIDAVIQ
jgi:ATP-dependent Clp protease protease subunit